MKMGEWHHRRGAKWMVSELSIWSDTAKAWVRWYEWKANTARGGAVGYAPYAFLARRRAIAALAKMAGGAK